MKPINSSKAGLIMEAIKFEHVSFAYDNGFVAVDDISLTIDPGEKVAIIGQNGAGKTTAVKMMNGLLRPKSGKIYVFGEETSKKTTATLSKKVGYVFQNPGDQIFNQTVYSEIAYSLKYLKIDKAEIERRVIAAAKMCYLSDELQTNPYDLPFSIRKFVTIASVVAMDADVVILDEPTAGQDLLGLTYQKEIIEQLHQRGKTVITISHDMEFVIENFDRILVMADKKIVGDADKREIFWNFELLDKAALKQPVVAQLANRLEMKRNIINIDDFVSEYEK